MMDAEQLNGQEPAVESSLDLSTDAEEGGAHAHGTPEHESDSLDAASEDAASEDAEFEDLGAEGHVADESDEPAAPDDVFSHVPAPLREALKERGFETLTPVQRSILAADSEGRELQVSSMTGSGKTVGLGFVLFDAVGPELAKPNRSRRGPVALVICPTRELAQQVSEELRWLFSRAGSVGVAAVTGGTPIFRDKSTLARLPEVLVGTPGRLLDHVRSGALDLAAVRELVLDEADQMLDMGFREDLEALLDAASGERRIHLVSATFPDEIQRLAQRYQTNALLIEGTPLGGANTDIEHIGHLVRPHDRYAALVNHLLLAGREKTLVFVERRADAADLAQQLEADGFPALPISGDLVQAQRDRALAAFRSGRVTILVATDVAARGLDVPDVSLVVQTTPPIDPETYTHRAGRTGRAGRKGLSLLLAPPPRRRHVERLLADAGVDIEWRPVPGAAEIQQKLESEARAVVARRVEGALERGSSDAHREHARALLAEHDAEELLASLLHAIEPKRRARPVDIDGGAAGAAGGQAGGRPFERRSRGPGDGPQPSSGNVRFFMNYGENQGANPARVLASLCRRGEVPGEAIGAIAIHPNATTFDVSAEHAEAFEFKASQRDPRDPQTFIRRDRGPAAGGGRRRGVGRRRRGYGARGPR